MSTLEYACALFDQLHKYKASKKGPLDKGGEKRVHFCATSLSSAFCLVSGSSSVVEHRLAKARVASSSLVSRSMIKTKAAGWRVKAFALSVKLTSSHRLLRLSLMAA